MRRKVNISAISSYTHYLIFANVIFFILAWGLGALSGVDCDSTVCKDIALQPLRILGGEGLWTFFTSMFMHAGLGHLFINMISLMFIGGFVEKLVGKKRFLSLYFAAGIFAGIFFVLFEAIVGGNLNIYAVGASGAIFGLGGLLAILTPRLPVLVFFIIPLPMWMAMVFLMVVLWSLSVGLGLPIGNTAHLGGLLIGVGYGLYLKHKYPHRTKMISRYFSK
ncbi:MAG: rhomboid family intramembrane serine protease [Nanoarchaeota archaeon]|nr:rhomboid family intramembrane serine protease [Nanoarchaeota archaeon]